MMTTLFEPTFSQKSLYGRALIPECPRSLSGPCLGGLVSEGAGRAWVRALDKTVGARLRNFSHVSQMEQRLGCSRNHYSVCFQ